MMRWLKFSARAFALMMFSGILAQAASVTGTVTNKTTGKPSAGDAVVLVDVQAGMSEAATATTDANGRYSLDSPGMGPYLIRVNHQGGTYFIAAPQGGSPGDITVYDIAAKVEGVRIDADMLLVEAAGGMLRIQERYLVRNTSLPPKAQFSDNTFEVVLPANAELDGASATRPGGLGTNTRLVPLGQKGHYTFNIPIQPDLGEKETMFEVQYHTSYNGKYTFTPHLQMPADNLVVYVPKSMSFGGGRGADFHSAQEDPRVQTFVAKGIHPGQAIEFNVSGEGQMPRDTQGGGMGQQAGAMGEAAASDAGNKPGGGLGPPIGTPDPLGKYKWWILVTLSILLAFSATFLLRRRGVETAGVPVHLPDLPVEPRPQPSVVRQPNSAALSIHAPRAGNTTLLSALKEELFAIESERIDGTLTQGEYDQIKTGLEAVLRRALKKS